MIAHRPLRRPVRGLARRAATLALGVALLTGPPPFAGPAFAAGYTDHVELAAHQVGAIRDVRLAVNKSLVVELPVDVIDVLVSGAEVADAVLHSSRRVYVNGATVGQTNIFFFDALGAPVLTLNISVEPDLETLQLTMDRLIPNGSVRVEGLNDSVALHGRVPDTVTMGRAVQIATAYLGNEEASVINMISLADPDQVMVKVTIAEVQRSVVKQLGIELDGQLGIGNTVLPFSSPAKFDGGVDPTDALEFRGAKGACDAAFGAASFAAAATGKIGCSFLFSKLKALEENGMVRTLAEPTLTALSGEEASFLVGGEFPVLGSIEDGIRTFDLKPYGVSLAMTPLVLGPGRINLKIVSEVSEIDPTPVQLVEGVTATGLTVRRADSTVELPSGGTVALAGLLQDDIRQTISGLPGLMKLPVLGSLFQSRSYQRNQTELVILVTPYLAKHAQRDRFALPTDGLTPATDADSLLLGRLHKVYGGDVKAHQRGRFGFIND